MIFLPCATSARWPQALAPRHVAGSPPVEHLVAYQGSWRGLPAPSPAWLGGVVVQPAETVLGLRGFEDAFETSVAWGQEHAPVVVFDLEKIIRMALAQSGLALEILGSAAIWHSAPQGWDPQTLARACFHKQVLRHYDDVSRQCLRLLEQPQLLTKDEPYVWSGLADMLTGATLAREGAFGLSVRELLSFWESLPGHAILDTASVSAAAPSLQDAPTRRVLYESAKQLGAWLDPSRDDLSAALPERVLDYEGVQRQLIEARRLTLG